MSGRSTRWRWLRREGSWRRTRTPNFAIHHTLVFIEQMCVYVGKNKNERKKTDLDRAKKSKIKMYKRQHDKADDDNHLLRVLTVVRPLFADYNWIDSYFFSKNKTQPSDRRYAMNYPLSRDDYRGQTLTKRSIFSHFICLMCVSMYLIYTLHIVVLRFTYRTIKTK